MKRLILIIILLVPFIASCQEENIVGIWRWRSDNGSERFKITITEKKGVFKGYHCGIFNNGSKIDCTDEGSSNSINLQKVSTNVYKGTIRSEYSLTSGEIELVYKSENNTIIFKVTKEPDGEYYFPVECVLKKIVSIAK